MRYIFGIGYLAFIGSIYPPEILSTALMLGVGFGVVDLLKGKNGLSK